MGWAQERLTELATGKAVLPTVVKTLRLGGLEAWGEGWIRKTWRPDPDVLSVDGSLFGGHLAALADQALTFAAMTVAGEQEAFRTVNLQLQFLRVGKAEPLNIEARVTAATKRLVTVEADFRRPDGALIARANAQQIVQPLPR